MSSIFLRTFSTPFQVLIEASLMPTPFARARNDPNHLIHPRACANDGKTGDLISPASLVI